ncbi:hypothetical protein DSO57_1001551 [Entomophthora muscae]|uniref:Uncharacterized protein n=1 Tax=Entomophthora muscae TaxID=34485 RepID=A0ACC2RP26_9FUNG|nr:hypothetical protein DSO57_1001551 [Entomophthora muscae]
MNPSVHHHHHPYHALLFRTVVGTQSTPTLLQYWIWLNLNTYLHRWNPGHPNPFPGAEEPLEFNNLIIADNDPLYNHVTVETAPNSHQSQQIIYDDTLELPTEDFANQSVGVHDSSSPLSRYNLNVATEMEPIIEPCPISQDATIFALNNQATSSNHISEMGPMESNFGMSHLKLSEDDEEFLNSSMETNSPNYVPRHGNVPMSKFNTPAEVASIKGKIQDLNACIQHQVLTGDQEPAVPALTIPH